MAEKRASTSRRPGVSKSASAGKSAGKHATKRPKAGVAVKASVKKKAPIRAVRDTGAKRPAAKAAPAKSPAKSPKPTFAAAPVVKVIEAALDDMKAVQVKVLDVRKLTDIADTLVIASGTSDRHVRSIADRVIEYAKKAGFRPMGVEGQRDGEWVLVDLQDVIVHIMLPRVRELYRLENLWDVSAARRDAAVGE
ncbi:ribosome silencing factor RsfS/YbeB/iojap [Povalibacter uvarum]|uniref:Ribosomal silencing factor RsfS n=1 Tax=Povalibacter uvarum TaxID=732238 RepID=A0A841HPY3_9GAMM|nr:ribosome silencing factor [Povalibacter uvarum]MBB6094300.1 ribosome silencing factor RsfS/YbeB/iojap [Povalibacter uvarum]